MSHITTEAELEERLSRPTELSLRAARGWRGDLLVLGAGGKMGASLLRLARRSADAVGRTSLRVIGASRFSQPGLREALERDNIVTIAGDLMDPAVRARLPDSPDVLFMLGYKFNAQGPPGIYWAMNTHLPGLLAEQFKERRIVAFSSGNVYPFTPVGQPAPTESTPPSPVGEYAMTAWGRERMLEYVSATCGTSVCLLRLNYAVDLRYGVVVDVAQKVRAGEPIDLSVPEFNYCWQGWANAVALAAFDQAASPATILNVTGTGRHRVRSLADLVGYVSGREAIFRGAEGPSSLVSDASRCHALYGPSDVTEYDLLCLALDWLRAGGRTLGKPTGFQVRDGKF